MDPLDASLTFTPRPHDMRIVRQGWVYYVRGVKKGEAIDGGLGLDGDLFSIGIWLVYVTIGWLIRRFQKSWKVGVLRFTESDRVMPIKVLYEEKLPGGTLPTDRISELVKEIESGRFDAERS